MCISHKNKINKPQIKWKMFYGFDLFSRSPFTAHPFSSKYLFLYSVLWRVRVKREITRLSQTHNADTECVWMPRLILFASNTFNGHAYLMMPNTQSTYTGQKRKKANVKIECQCTGNGPPHPSIFAIFIRTVQTQHTIVNTHSVHTKCAERDAVYYRCTHMRNIFHLE